MFFKKIRKMSSSPFLKGEAKQHHPIFSLQFLAFGFLFLVLRFLFSSFQVFGEFGVCGALGF